MLFTLQCSKRLATTQKSHVDIIYCSCGRRFAHTNVMSEGPFNVFIFADAK